MRIVLSLIIIFIALSVSAQWENFDNSNVPEIKSNEVRSIALDNNNILWFGTTNGLVSYDGQSWTRYTSDKNSISGNAINQLKLKNQENTLLLATDNGSNIIDISDGFDIKETYQTSNSGIYDDKVYSFEVNMEDIKVFGTGKGLSVFNNSVWAPIQGLAAIDSINLAQNPVISIESTADNTFIASDGKGIYLTSNEVDGISFVTNWVFPYNIPTSDNIKTAYVDSEGNQWYGTDAGAVYHEGLKAQEGSWGNPVTTSEGLPDNLVNSIIEDSYGHVWFGTANGLAVRMNDDTWKIYNTEDGMSGNMVYDILEDTDNRIWIATDQGISKFSPPWVTGIEPDKNSYFKVSIHPNPASKGVWIKYNLPESGPLKLGVYDISGKLIIELKNEYGPEGNHEFFWNILDKNGFFVSSGIYFVRIESRNLISTRKMIILR